MSNYHGCKEEAINLIPQYLKDIIHKLVKPSHLEKLKIIQNVNKLMFWVIFTFSDWILIEQIIPSSHLFCLEENIFSKTSTSSFEWRDAPWVKKHRFNDFQGMWTTQIENFSTHVRIYKSEKIQKHSGEIKPEGV